MNRQPDQAMTLLGQATAADSQYAPAWNDLGVLFMRSDTTVAIANFKKAGDLDENNSVPRFNLADLYRQYGVWKLAEPRYNDVIDMGRGNVAEAYWGRARVKEATGREAAAIEDYKSAIREKAIREKSMFANAYNDLGFLFLKMGQADSAATWVRTALDQKPPPTGDAAAYLWKNLGEALRMSEDWVGADSAYGNALKLKPNFPAAQEGRDLARRHQAGGKTPENTGKN